MIPNREEALALLKTYTHTEELINHALSVEGVMRHFARLYGQDEELWGAVGLLHDLDYEQWPDEHCQKCVELMHGAGIDESFIRAVVSHGYGLVSDTAPESDLEKVLYTIDELTGLITACALVRPSHSVMDLELKSLKKKFKSKAFAAGCDRKVILRGCEMLGKEPDWVMAEAIAGMREIADTIGLGMAQ
ncbi:HDIG domain-containing protein [Neobittarella massiliensis]|uniref:HDIG domain-containing protein n=1 Tax=Neobittarella massiliensis (ex Bilen et al. 2018) TaxID=2041842 RepID=A0A8J6IPU9_9FIRM|nr:HDIG domain-containing metalloprotein [Neobittarella massiliensis]MBC3516343.1 HDIG domain-containing protein [Neobittarella massiliensis]